LDVGSSVAFQVTLDSNGPKNIRPCLNHQPAGGVYEVRGLHLNEYSSLDTTLESE
jgi:hypothetical protein